MRFVAWSLSGDGNISASGGTGSPNGGGGGGGYIRVRWTSLTKEGDFEPAAKFKGDAFANGGAAGGKTR